MHRHLQVAAVNCIDSSALLQKDSVLNVPQSPDKLNKVHLVDFGFRGRLQTGGWRHGNGKCTAQQEVPAGTAVGGGWFKAATPS